jgi:transcription antitermination factor NusG
LERGCRRRDGRHAVVVVTGKIGEIDSENGIVRVDLSVVFNETTVLGKAQAKVRL